MTEVEKTIKDDEAPQLPTLSYEEFLVTAPAGTIYDVPDLFEPLSNGWRTSEIAISLYCASDSCSGNRLFGAAAYLSVYKREWLTGFASFRCRNCQAQLKVYALYTFKTKGHRSGNIIKIGEWPQLELSVPSKVISIIGPDRETFLKGLKAEAQGLGIGAFGYYRRVVDNQWKRIIESIEKAAINLHAGPDAIATIAAAANETQFSKAIETLKDAIPPSLLISGQHNALALLYKATSNGIHNLSDGQCLELAKDVRLVLTELAERMTTALGDQSALNSAVSRLMKLDSR